MRVVWVPHPGLAEVCQCREMDVLMGRTEENGQPPDFSKHGHRTELNETGGLLSEDGRAEMRASLENFPHDRYGMHVRKYGY